ncbi:MAG: helix-turn-helix domain-containing protein [Devosia sp.]
MLIESVAFRESFAFVPPAFQPEGRPTLAGLFSHQPVERIDAGAALFWQGDRAAEVFEVMEGALRIVRILGDGRRVITGFLFAGDLVGVSQREQYLYTAEAIEPTRVRQLARRRFDEAIDKQAELRSQLVGLLCDEMTAAHEQVVLLARKSAEERVSSFLLALVRRVSKNRPSARVVDLPMTRLDMADYLGLTIETVSRVMTRLQVAEVISQTGRHTVVVLRPARLATLAADDEDDGIDAPVSLCSH